MAFEFSNNFVLESGSRDSGISSFSSDCNDSNNSLNFKIEQEELHLINTNISENKYYLNLNKENTFKVKYLGERQLSRRHTPYMIPWVVDEIRTCGKEYDCNVSVTKASINSELIVLKIDLDETISNTHLSPNKYKHLNLEHNLNNLTRFSKSASNHSHFSYLYRDSPESPFTCFLFNAVEEKIVNDIFYAIHNAMLSSSLTMFHEPSSPPASICQNEENLHKVEVIYLGKIVVATKKASPSFIDEAVKKFHDLGRWDKFSKDLTSCNINTSKFNFKPVGPDTGSIMKEIGQRVYDRKSKMTCILESQDEDNTEKTAKTKSVCIEDSTLDSKTQNCDPDTMKSDIQNDKQISNGDDEIKNTFNNSNNEKNHEHQESQQHYLNKSQQEKSKQCYLVVSRDYLTLQSINQPQPLREWKFKNITFCSQGVIYSNHIGFIARSNDSNKFTCFIFKCSSESSVDEMMMSIKKAFQEAVERCSRHQVVCELCPMHQLHKLCLQLENKDDGYIFSALFDRITYLEHCYKLEIYCDKKTTYNVPTLHETNVNMMSCIMKLCDKQQLCHVHVNDSKCSNTSNFMLYPQELDPNDFQFKVQGIEGSSAGNNDVLFGSNYSLLSCPAIEDIDGPYNSTNNHLNVDGCSNKVKLRRHSVPYTLPVGQKIALHDASPDINLSSSQKKLVMVVSDGRKEQEDGGLVLVDKRIPYDSPIRTMFNKVGSHNGCVMTRSKQHLKQIGKSGSTSSSSSSSSSIFSPRLSLDTAVKEDIKTLSKYRGAWQINVISIMNLNKNYLMEDENELDGLRDGDRYFHPKSTWKKAISDTILLIKINKKNQKSVTNSETEYYEGVGKRVNYQEVTPCLKGVKKLWRQLLDTDLWKTIKLDRKILIRSVRDGVPKEMRGDIWKLLIHQNKLHQNGNVDHQEFNNNISNKTTSEYDALDYDLLKNQLTSHQHAILIDLGRTFPSHPFFSSAAGPGQASLFNILKAYSVLDAEVGYCQGLSFVAGVILIHVNERDAFDVLKYIMFELGFRRHYRPDMVPLQVSMYQLTRMLHDSYKDLFDHFDANQIAPTLYAAPWFLTIFASQFPLGFVARVFDLILMHGTEVIIKVALVLLDNHRELIKQCSSFESLVEFLKITLPDMAIIQMEKIFNQVYSMDITRCLEAYEMEYHILHEEISRPIKNSSQIDDCDKILTRLTRIQLVNDSLRRQKMELLEQLQIARRQILSLEEENCFLSNNQMKLKSQNQILELERTALLKMIDQMNNKNEVNPNPEKSEELITNMHSSSGENAPPGI